MICEDIKKATKLFVAFFISDATGNNNNVYWPTL